MAMNSTFDLIKKTRKKVQRKKNVTPLFLFFHITSLKVLANMNPINKVLQNFKQLSYFLTNNEKHFLINFGMHNSKIFIIQSKTNCNS